MRYVQSKSLNRDDKLLDPPLMFNLRAWTEKIVVIFDELGSATQGKGKDKFFGFGEGKEVFFIFYLFNFIFNVSWHLIYIKPRVDMIKLT